MGYTSQIREAQLSKKRICIKISIMICYHNMVISYVLYTLFDASIWRGSIFNE